MEEEIQVSTHRELAVALPYLPHTRSSSSSSYLHSSVALTTRAMGLLRLQWAGRPGHTRPLGVGPRESATGPLHTHNPAVNRHSECPLAAVPSQGEWVVCEALA